MRQNLETLIELGRIRNPPQVLGTHEYDGVFRVRGSALATYSPLIRTTYNHFIIVLALSPTTILARARHSLHPAPLQSPRL